MGTRIIIVEIENRFFNELFDDRFLNVDPESRFDEIANEDRYYAC